MPTLSRTSYVSRARIAMALGFSLVAGAAHAEGLIAVTEQLSVSAAHPVADLIVQNTSAEEATVHFDVSAWRQEGEREHLTPDHRLIVHPDTIRLKAGEIGRTRVGLKLSGPRWDEEAFRVRISESLPIPDVGVPTVQSSGSRTVQRGSVPVFLLPPGDANPRMTWHFERNHDGAVILRANNDGRGHFRLKSANLTGPGGQSIFKGNLSDFLLPGGSRSWEFTAAATSGMWLLTADTNAGLMKIQLELGPTLTTGRALTLGN